jgi:hypothetical protein
MNSLKQRISSLGLRYAQPSSADVCVGFVSKLCLEAKACQLFNASPRDFIPQQSLSQLTQPQPGFGQAVQTYIERSGSAERIRNSQQADRHDALGVLAKAETYFGVAPDGVLARWDRKSHFCSFRCGKCEMSDDVSQLPSPVCLPLAVPALHYDARPHEEGEQLCPTLRSTAAGF